MSDQYNDPIFEKVAEIYSKIDFLKEESSSMKKADRSEYQNMMNFLDEKKRNLELFISDLQRANAESYDSVKKKVDRNLRKIRSELQNMLDVKLNM